MQQNMASIEDRIENVKEKFDDQISVEEISKHSMFKKNKLGDEDVKNFSNEFIKYFENLL